MFTKGAVEKEILRAKSIKIFSSFSRSLWASWFHPQYPHRCWLVVQSCSEIKLISSLWLLVMPVFTVDRTGFQAILHLISANMTLIHRAVWINSYLKIAYLNYFLFGIGSEWVSVLQVRWWWCSVLIAWFKFLKGGNEQLRIMTIKVIMGILVLTQTPFQLWRKELFP